MSASFYLVTASGEWLLAYQAEQTKYLRAMFASVRSTFQRNMAVTKEPSVAEVPEIDNSPILDKAFIVSSVSLLLINFWYCFSSLNTVMWKIHMIFMFVILMVVIY